MRFYNKNRFLANEFFKKQFFKNKKIIGMKKFILIPSLMLFCFLLFSFNPSSQPEPQVVNNVMVQFITTNYYGNNLYIDNFMLGTQFNNDIVVSSINNISKDTSYSVNGSSSFIIPPKVTFVNLGRQNITSAFNVTMLQVGGSYTSTKQISSINSGQGVEITFDNLTITPSTPLNLKVYSSLASDENKTNDTLYQYSYFLPGTRRNVLFEAYTNASCGPCALENPSLDAFVAARFDTICAIKYHTSWPGPGDPMYQFNIPDNTTRTNYYSINAVPTLQVDGVIQQVSGYTELSNLLNPYNTRLGKGSPLGLTVVDSRVAGDSIKADITLTIYSPLTAGNYKMRVCANERTITYGSPPGSNGETIFRDVFRTFFPNSTGTTISTTPGVYNFSFTYKRNAAWVDSMIYTTVFVQNDNNKEVLNASKARHYSEKIVKNNNPLNNDNFTNVKAIYRPDIFTSNSKFSKNSADEILSGLNVEMFEGSFPPAGWTLINPDGGLTFVKFSGTNGPLLGGNNCVKMPFYDYSVNGQMDYLKTKVYNNVELTDTLEFNWAYAPYPPSTTYPDRLQVKVSTDGGATFPYTIFDKAGDQLGTSPATTNPFVPASASDWGTFKIRFGSIVSDITPISTEVPEKFSLKQNFPNPFNPVTNIRFDLARNGNITLKVYDVLGNLVTTLYDGYKSAGTYNATFEGSGFASGIYFCKLQANGFTDVKRMVLVK